MGVNHVVFDGDTIVDLRDITVAPENLLSGVTACNAAGEKITGSFTLDTELATQDSLIAQIVTALEGKSAGGGASVETCTLKSSPGAYTFGLKSTDGVASLLVTTDAEQVVGFIADNVVCGSTLVCFTPSSYTLLYEGAELVNEYMTLGARMHILTITAGAGETVTLTAWYND